MALLVTDNSSELATLARLYQIGLGREADPNGLAFWAEAVEAGLPLDAVARAFAATRAFNAVYDADLDDGAFVEALFERALGRDADDAGRAFWVDALGTGFSRAEALLAFTGSAEAQSARDVTGEDGLEIAGFAPSAFGYGVASGDPAVDSVVLWTHARPAGAEGEVTVGWEVSTDAEFSEIVASGEATTSADDDYTVKVIPEGLEAGQTYFYRFTADGETSMTGETRTLPEGDLESLVLAVFSCTNYPAGFFNVYDAAVEAGFDYSVHLGDYIYEYGLGGYATGAAEALGRVPDPVTEIVTLADYSARYAQYHADADMQALRAAAPMIVMWDDHETANDAWAGGSENHDPATEGPWDARVDSALEAYYNWTPIREPESGDPKDADRSFDFGTLASLHMLETRLQARDETRADTPAAVLAKATGYATDPASLVADLLAFPDLVPAGVDPTDPAAVAALAGDQAFVVNLALTSLLAEAADPAREMIGADQLAEVSARIDGSDATWQIVGSQTLMARMELPAPILLDPTGGLLGTYGVILEKLAGGVALTGEEQALLDAPRVPYNLDAWDGYAAEREALLEALGGRPSVVVAGDTHNAWFSEVTTADGALAAMEFGGPGVTSPGFEAVFPDVPPAQLAALLVAYIDALDFANTSDRGFMRIEVTPEQVQGDYVFVDTTLDLDYETVVHSETAGVDLFG